MVHHKSSILFPQFHASALRCFLVDYAFYALYILVMQASPTTSPAALVRHARRVLALTQADFAIRVGRTQTVISKYEAGLVDPPAEIIMHCMHVINSQPSMQADAAKDPNWAGVVAAMSRLQEALQAAYATSRGSQ
jgi:DNA-binding XRE family transcriptional regulator